MQVVIFEDILAAELRPVTLTRPAFGINLCGTSLYDLITSQDLSTSYIVREYLKDFCLRHYPFSPLKKGSILFINACLPPSLSILKRILTLAERGDSFLAQKDSRVVCAFFPELEFKLEELNELSVTGFLQAQDYILLEDKFPLLTFPFDVIKYHLMYFKENLEELSRGFKELEPGVFVGSGVKIHSTVCMNAEEGIIIIDENTRIGPFVYLEGPLYIGKNCNIQERASIKKMSHISHTCKVGGEVECSIMEPFSNKQHHGFLGHSWVGSWVNMGAGTSTSNLKTTYGEVAVNYQGKKIPTGMQFLGCIIGDYTKTAINTSIFTGKIIGVASYLYGFVTSNVPSFCNYARTFGKVTEHYLPAVVRTQRRMFARRDVKQTHLHIKLLEDVYRITRDERMMSLEPFSF